MSVLRGDALTIPMRDNSVDLIVTSPPYFALRSYLDDGQHYAGQIGSEPTPTEFLEALWAVTKECWRVLKPSGSLFVNLGDKYAERAGPPRPAHLDFDGGVRRQADRPYRGRRDVRTKSLHGLPWRYAHGCIEGEATPCTANHEHIPGLVEIGRGQVGTRSTPCNIKGWILRAEIIWDKPNGLPESVTDRVRASHEHWFHLVKSNRYFAALDEIREPHTGGAHPGRKDGQAPNGGKLERTVATGDRGAVHAGTNPHMFNPLGKLPGSVWRIPSEPLNVPAELGVDHFAAFPTEWPRRLILGWSPSGYCNDCDQPLRPTVDVDHEKYRDAPSTGRPHAQNLATVGGGWNNAGYAQTRTTATITGYECACDTPPHNIRPAVILDPFGGTGTTAMVARALGRTGVSIDMSADYCRLANWRINHSDHDLKAIARTYSHADAQSAADQRAASRAGQNQLF